MKRFLPFIVLMLLSISSFSQAPSGMGKNDPDAKKVLDAISTKFKKFKSIKAKFSLKIENASSKVIGNKSGTVYMKGSKYMISLPGQEIYCDGSNVWTYDKSSNEVTISKLDPSSNSLTPQKLFTNFYDKDFLYKLNDDVTVVGKKMQVVELTPIDKSKPFHKVLLYVNNSSIATTKIFEKTGNRYTYSVPKMETTAIIPDASFVFVASKYPGVEIVDLR
ncbi:MAG: outer membrane lipoprotein carrier protein LolA [Ferruginibacter sp.]